jgi:Tfp pilus assembly protein PilF
MHLQQYRPEITFLALMTVVSWNLRAVAQDVTHPDLYGNPRPATESVVITARRHNQLGMAAQSRGELDTAIREYKQAIALEPEVAAYHNNLAMALKDIDRFEEAKQEELKAINLKGYKGSYHYNLGIILQRMQEFEDAEHEFRIATEKDALDCDFRFKLAQSLLQLRQAPQAEEEARILISTNAQEASYHKLLADALYAQSKNEDALYEYKRALEIKPVSADTREIENKIASIRETLGLR